MGNLHSLLSDLRVPATGAALVVAAHHALVELATLPVVITDSVVRSPVGIGTGFATELLGLSVASIDACCTANNTGKFSHLMSP
jgi:hypothetical protein